MKLMVASYNNGAVDWNAEAEETAFVSYRLVHRFNEPAEAHIILADPTGVIGRKYNVDANDVYIGPAKITIEDPTGTDIFYGRIMRATASTQSRTVELYCQDWLSQLDEEPITYDMREDLDGAGLRQSEIFPDYDNGDGLGIRPAYNNAGTRYVYDHNMSWAAGAWNGMYMVLSDEMAGTITVRTGPYAYTTTAALADVFTHDIGDLWDADGDTHTTAELSPFVTDYKFRVWVPDSDFHETTLLTGAKIIIYYEGSTTISTIELYNSAGYDELASADTPGTDPVWQTVTIPDNLVVNSLDANGEVIVRLNEPTVTGGGFVVDYVMVEYVFTTTGYSSTISISDTIANRLTIGTDLSADATRVWHGVPYAIARPIYKHIDSAETPGDLITAGDVLVALTCAATIEHTSGISTRQYVEQTRLDMLRDLARQDKAEFWEILGTTTVNWKSTWNDAGADETLTDTDVNSWTAIYDYQPLANKFTVYGMRIGDRQLYSTYSDAASIAKYKATRARVRNEGGLVSEYDTLARATALVNQSKDVQMMLRCIIAGNAFTVAHAKTLVLGYEVQVTSTYLGLTNAWYIVDEIQYDSREDVTNVQMHPRVSVTGLQREEMRNSTEGIIAQAHRGTMTADKYVPRPWRDRVV